MKDITYFIYFNEWRFYKNSIIIIECKMNNAYIHKLRKSYEHLVETK